MGEKCKNLTSEHLLEKTLGPGKQRDDVLLFVGCCKWCFRELQAQGRASSTRVKDVCLQLY